MRILGRMGYWTIVGLATLIGLLSMHLLTFNPQVLDVFLQPSLSNHPIPF